MEIWNKWMVNDIPSANYEIEEGIQNADGVRITLCDEYNTKVDVLFYGFPITVRISKRVSD